MAKNLLSVFDLSAQEIWSLLILAAKLKKGAGSKPYLRGKSVGLIFEKPSTRTSVSFSVATYQLHGFPLMLDAKNLQRKRGETIHDTSQTLSRYLNAIVIRAFKHTDVEEFAQSATIPVINGLTDREHPCQILGDLLTIMEQKKVRSKADFKKIKIVFVGDGNNVAHSLLASASLLGLTFSFAGPKGYGPDEDILARAKKAAAVSGAKIEVTSDEKKAVKDADIIYTDVWTSMGAESETEKRKRVFRPYQVNSSLLRNAKPGCSVMHCLPAVRGEEITADIIDGPNSIVFDQAENRLHIQKAILISLLTSKK